MMRATGEEAQRQFREAISHLVTGVTVITARAGGEPRGMTASSVCSLSLEPIQLLVCIERSLPTHRALERSGRFVVNVLGEGQQNLARRFATPGVDKFAGVDLRTEHDLPVLEAAIAWFVCETAERYPGGDHSIFIGRVVDFGHLPRSRPLAYFASDFEQLESEVTQLLRYSWSYSSEAL